MPKVFVSYRQSDSRLQAQRIADDLIDEFGAGSVFFDSETLEPGHGLTAEIQANLANSTHILIVIGPDWLVKNPRTGEVRITEKDDWVRAELHAALAGKATVIPVLVGGAQMPQKSDLPLDLRDVPEKLAITLHENSFKGDLKVLIDRLRDRSALAAGLAVFGAALVAGFLYYLVDGLVELLQGAYIAINRLENELAAATYEIGQLKRADGTTDKDAAAVVFDYEAASKAAMPYWVQGKFIGENARLFVYNVVFVTYFGLIVYGALRAARGYVSIPSERLFPAVAWAGAAYLAVSIVYFGPIEFWTKPSERTEKLLFSVGAETLRWTAFCGALAISLRRPLHLKKVDLVLLMLCAAIGASAANYLVNGTSIAPSAWVAAIERTGISLLHEEIFSTDFRTGDGELNWRALAKTALGTKGGTPGPGGFLIKDILDGHPVCLTNGVFGRTSVCHDMSLVILHTLIPVFGLMCACLVPRWRISIFRVLLIGLATLVFAVLMVNLLAIFELMIEHDGFGRSEESKASDGVQNFDLLVDAAVPQMFLYAFMALMVARFGLRRRSRRRPALPAQEQMAS